jgi:hypothetical protein
MSNKFERMKDGLAGLASNPPQPLLGISDKSLEEVVRQQGETINAAHRTIKEQATTIEQQRTLISDVTQALSEDEGESNG